MATELKDEPPVTEHDPVPEADAVPHGKKAQAVFDRVTELMSDGMTSRSQAIDMVAQETGKANGTITAQYRQIAKKSASLSAPDEPLSNEGEAVARKPRAPLTKPRRGPAEKQLDDVIKALEGLRGVMQSYDGLAKLLK